MSDLLTHVGELEMVDVDLDKEPECESLNHGGGCHGPAAYWMTAPCGHHGLRCSERAQVIATAFIITCCHCRADALASDYTLIEL